ncbi:MAG: PVC-type heme-binding CxxCH protein [Rubripirellula sp.]
MPKSVSVKELCASPAFALGFILLAATWLGGSVAEAQKTIVHTSEEPLSPHDAADSMRVPEGFRVTLFAGEPDVMQPIGFCIDDRNRLWVAEAYNYPHHGTEPGDRIVILDDTNGDGQHDKRTVFFEGLNYVSGIEVGFGGAWVMSPPFMYFIPDKDGDDVPDAEPEVLLDGFGNHANAHNMANGFAWGPDGWLYATHGRTNWSLIGKPGESEQDRKRFDGGVWRYHPVRHVWEPVADGTTNPWGIDWNDYGDSFICNCVNPHLFQVIPGAHYEPWRGRKSSEFAYQRIGTIADHLHFVGLGNVRNGLGSEAEDTAGGGHAHCGTMIYLGAAFPERYRNQLFTNNIHGRRINNDLLRMSGSGYVASHGPDLMRSDDPWFMGVTLAYGGGGEVYVSDWSDTGECHSTKQTRRNTGRLYRITFGGTTIDDIDLAKKTTDELVELQLHDNDWMVRHARRLLHERTVQGESMDSARERLRDRLTNEAQVPKRLRALWALQVTGGVDIELLGTLMDDSSEFLQQWAIRLACEQENPGREILEHLAELASHSSSPRVRLELASTLQRLALSERWAIAEALVAHEEDDHDANIPLMVWYGVEPLVHEDVPRFVELATTARLARVRENVSRRMLALPNKTESLAMLTRQLENASTDGKRNVLDGILLGLEGQRRAPMPDVWPAAYQTLLGDKDRHVRQQATRLALLFQDESAIKRLRLIAGDVAHDVEMRRIAIDALVNARVVGFDAELRALLGQDSVRAAALRGLASYDAPDTAKIIVSGYANCSDAEKQIALNTLATRLASSQTLLDAIEAGVVPVSDVTAFTARQIRSHEDLHVNDRLRELWGEVRESPRDRVKMIEGFAKSLTTETLARADLDKGRALFAKHCGTCHRFFGEGGNVGPDITGAQRNNVRYLLENMVDPNASVAKEFRMQLVRTTDGRVFTGLVEAENEETLTLVNATERLVLPRAEIEAVKESEVSVMPAGLLDPLSEREIRDLIGYLQK